MGEFLEETDKKEKESRTVVYTSAETAIIGEIGETIRETSRCLTEYAKYREHEITERKRINAELKVRIHKIDAQKEIFLKLLENSFEERKLFYKSLTEARDAALKNNDTELLKWVYTMMLETYKNAPEYKAMGNLLEGR